MVAGVLLGVFIVNPSLVTKEDGTKVKIAKQKSVGEELKAVLSVITDYNMIRLFPIFFSSNFFYTYVFNAFNGALFTVRTRGFNSAFFWMAQMFGSVLFAKVVDVPKNITRSIYNRAWRGYALVFVVVTISWAIGLYLQLGFRGGYVNVTDLADEAIIDFQDKDWVFPFFVMIGYGLADSIIQTFSYWIMSIIAGNDTVLAARYAGYYKGVQSLGAAVAWLLDSNYIMTPARTQLYICVGLFYVSMIPVIPVVVRLKGMVLNHVENDEDLSSSTDEHSPKGTPIIIPEQA